MKHIVNIILQNTKQVNYDKKRNHYRKLFTSGIL